MRLIVSILGILFLSVGVFGQAFDEDEPAPEKKSAPKAVVQEKKVEVTVPAAPAPTAPTAPAAPAQAVPAVPAQTVPATPVLAIPATPAKPAPMAPAQVVPAAPAQTAPAVPAQVAPAAVPAVKPEAVKKVPVPAEADSTILSETVCAVTGTNIKVTEKTPSSGEAAQRACDREGGTTNRIPIMKHMTNKKRSAFFFSIPMLLFL